MPLPYTLHLGDCLEVMQTLADNSVDSIVTDPPYGLSSPPDMVAVLHAWLAGENFEHSGSGFMGKAWDSFVPGPATWRECLRVLKPGGHLLAFFGTRTHDLGTLAIRLAGFEIRDTIAWVHGSGFPKSRDVSEAMSRFRRGIALVTPLQLIGADVYRVTAFLRRARDAAGWNNRQIDALFGTNGMAGHWTSSASQPEVPSLRQWAALKQALGFGDELDSLVATLAATERKGLSLTRVESEVFLSSLTKDGEEHPVGGWGTALKPAFEPITMARKPLAGTTEQNVWAYGTGALNIDDCRVEVGDAAYTRNCSGDRGHGGTRVLNDRGATDLRPGGGSAARGRWPANLIHDGSDEVVRLFPVEAGAAAPVLLRNGDKFRNSYGTFRGDIDEGGSTFQGDVGSAARFFYCPKACRSDRNEGCEAMPAKPLHWSSGSQNPGSFQSSGTDKTSKNHHPTVKPTDLMAYLCRLVTPPGGLVLDPFMGSGSTGKACMREGFHFIGIERDQDEHGQSLGYLVIAEARIAYELEQRKARTAQLDFFNDQESGA